MKLDKFNVFVRENGKDFRILIMLPNSTGNFLHSEDFLNVNDALKFRDILLQKQIDTDDVYVEQEDGYYRMMVKIKDVDVRYNVFHGRKLNMIDLIYERDELLNLKWKDA